jgi:16S rRNA A1518/A1519 N6-dimethyltransferase RsmA/KsgA/DIM1 with predicted DNA glycosylase/AP lyase activity
MNLDKSQIDNLLLKCDFDLNIRAENLSIDDYIKIIENI